MTRLLNLDDYRLEANSKLSKAAFDYYASGAHDQVTLQQNCDAFEQICLHYKVLQDVSQRSLQTTVLGQPVSMPVLIAPTAFHGLAAKEAEIATAQAATKAETIMTLSTLSNSAMEDVSAAAKSGFWFQLYCYRDRAATEALVQRAVRAGAQALVLTVDAPKLGCREADERNNFQLPPGLQVKNMTASGMADFPKEEGSGLAAYFASLIDASLNWKDLAWLKSITKLPLLLKGVVRVDDALRAIDHGVDGLIVSNHGGRQLDTSPPTISVLGPIAKAVKGRLPILLDGGVRRGTDVVKALALGAQAVLIGRPVLWGLAAGGSQGVIDVLELFRKELDLAMTLCGTPTIESITEDLISP